jgi:uncharacterized membrane protein
MAGQAISNVTRIAKLEEEHLHARSRTERVAGAVSAAASTATFAVVHAVWFAVWVVINVRLVPGIRPFDPYPFNFLTLVVSLEAIFLSIWILISQNQMARQADLRAHLDLQINLLAEQESTAVLRILRQVCVRLGVDPDEAGASAALAEETNVERVATAVERTLDSSS